MGSIIIRAMRADSDSSGQTQTDGGARLGLNRSTVALLLAILFIGMGQELWAPFMPKFIQQTIEDHLRGRLSMWGLPAATVIVLLVGLYGTWRDFQEGIYYYLGGRLGGALGTRTALIAFAALPLIGYAMIQIWVSPYVAFIALPFIVAYDSIAQPATLTVIGQTLGERHRTMAISLQSIQRRIPRIIAYLAGGALVAGLGAIGGVRVAVAISSVLVLIAVLMQVKLLHSHTKDAARGGIAHSKGLLKKFPRELKRLLLADILARVAEGLPRELFVLFSVVSVGEVAGFRGLGTFGLTASTFGQLLALQAFTSLMIYFPVGWLAARPGASKRPFITLTFIFFAIFPLAFWWLGSHWGVWGLALAYVIAGLREIGEPARKAMITELVPPQARTTAIGLYWAVRTFSVMLMPMIGAIIWVSISPEAVFITACAAGALGAVAFAMSGRGAPS